MVAPVTGPFGPSADVDTSLQFRQKRWSRQTRPYNLLLGYTLRDIGVTRFVDAEGARPADWKPTVHNLYLSNYVESGIPTVDNTTYAKLRGKLYQSNADFGVVLGEHSSAREMLTKRAGQMVDLARFLQGGNIKAADDLARTMSPRVRRPRKGANSRWLVKRLKKTPAGMASLWLEYSWGWAPAYEDIVKSLTVLTDPVLDKQIRVSHEQTFELTQEDSKWSNTWVGPGVYRSGHQRTVYNFTYRCASGCSFVVTNHNVLLANRLGLLNLPKLVYSVTAFSFLLEKYVNVGQMISSLTDLYGLSISRSWTSRRIDGYVNQSRDFVDLNAPQQGSLVSRVKNYQLAHTYLKERRSGLIGPTLTTREASVGSFGEAASYFALLIQILSKW